MLKVAIFVNDKNWIIIIKPFGSIAGFVALKMMHLIFDYFLIVFLTNALKCAMELNKNMWYTGRTRT